MLDKLKIPERHYLNNGHSLASWLLTKDHKRIAIMYLISISVMFFLGGLFAIGIRLELATPQGDFVTADTYNKFFTMHGVIMVFFFLIPSIPAVLGNFLIPPMIGAKDLAFPRINLISLYIYWIGGVFTLYAMIAGGVDTGWTFYTPYSATGSNTNVVPTAVGVFIAGFSSILTGLNFIVTIHRMRAPGMTWFRLPLFVWAHYATSLVQVLGTPVVAITIVMLGVERALGFGIFDPARGGDPVLFQHLFWFYSHPAVYIMILPALGVQSELVSTFSRKTIFGYSFVAFSSLAIAVFGFIVWAHHMFVAGISTYAAMVFSFLSFSVAIPSAVKVFNWTATLYKGAISFETPMLYAYGFLGLFAIGGLTGLFLATLGLDVHVHDTYFVVAHFHYIMVGGAIMGYMGGLHFWWPKMTGRMYSEFFSRVSAIMVFVGFNVTFFPQFVVGYLGMPRRYHSYPDEFQVLNVMSSAGATVLGLGYALPVLYFLWSLRYGAVAGPNPWRASGLEWQMQSPPLTENFVETPIVDTEPYEYEHVVSREKHLV
ncbi:MAG: cytochrome c oxidase subunit I [Acidobacteria bacterium RIFCSPLOWO2_12_FULL_66_10]|nr:MAG: cytochrome c oxidase subunit I [Acidobacteria bacterium RIFCSPLOWO2_12_FULL_66_10]